MNPVPLVIFALTVGMLLSLSPWDRFSLALDRERRGRLQAQLIPSARAIPPKAQIRALQRDSSNAFKLYAATADGLQVSEDRGQSWKPVLVGGRDREVFAISVHPTKPEILFVGRRDGLWQSRDGGSSWQELSYPQSVPLSIAISDRRPDTIYLATSRNGIYKSSNGGYQWAEASNGLPQARLGGRPEEIHALAVDPLNPDLVYAGISRHGVYRTVDGGVSWHAFNQNLAISIARTVYPPKLVIDLDDAPHLYLSFNERIHSHLIQTRLYVLTENLEWMPIEAKLPPNFVVQDLAVNKTKRTLELWGANSVWEVPLTGKGLP